MNKNKDQKHSLEIRLTALVGVMCFLLAATAVFAGAYWHTRFAARECSALADSLVHGVADDVERDDPGGEGLVELLTDARDTAGAYRVYICAPSQYSNEIIADSNYDSPEPAFELSIFNEEDILDGLDTAPAIWDGNRRVAAVAPITSDGRLCYVVVEFDMSGSVRDAVSFALIAALCVLAGAAALTALYWKYVRDNVTGPLRSLSSAADDYYEGGNRQAFTKLKIAGSNELSDLAESFRMMLGEIEVNNLEQREKAVQEQKVAGDMAFARDLNAAARPKTLPGDDQPFKVTGAVKENGRALTGCFYDFFVTENGKLCFALGETSGEGMPQAIFAVIGETTLKSHLRSGLSLEQAFSAANRQLYEMGGGHMYMSVVAGVLDGNSGELKLVNAGQCLPHVMRFSEGRYERSDALPQVPVGQNEDVQYTATALRLRQGDRLFLNTNGLEAIEDRDGKKFRDKLRMCLNELMTRTAETDEQLELVSSAGEVFAAYAKGIEPYALMSVEFSRRDRMDAHFAVNPDSSGIRQLERFLREQLSANGVSQKRSAEVLVIADELFALCRAHSDGESRFMAECSVRDNVAALRFRGRMGGADPLEEAGNLSGSAKFVRKYCENVSFEKSGDIDTLTAVCKIK